MPGAPDPALAARRVADPSTLDGAAEFLTRYAEGAKRCGDASMLARAIATLKPVLDAVARGAEGGRVERWARAMDPDLWAKVDGAPSLLDPALIERAREDSLRRARAALALADAEAAARREAGWRAYEEAKGRLGGKAVLNGLLLEAEDFAALDAAVRGMAG